MMKDDDFKLLRVLQTNGRMDEQTFAIVESLSRLKKYPNLNKVHKTPEMKCFQSHLLLQMLRKSDSLIFQTIPGASQSQQLL